jgi:hypothetical protein
MPHRPGRHTACQKATQLVVVVYGRPAVKCQRADRIKRWQLAIAIVVALSLFTAVTTGFGGPATPPGGPTRKSDGAWVGLCAQRSRVLLCGLVLGYGSSASTIFLTSCACATCCAL